MVKRIIFFGIILCLTSCKKNKESEKMDTIIKSLEERIDVLHKKSDNVRERCCFARSAMIFWNSESSDAEKELKDLLTRNEISYVDLKSQKWDSETLSVDGIRDFKLSFLVRNDSWNTLSLPMFSSQVQKISSSLSKLSKSPVIAFLEFEQSAWGYCLFENGQLIDTFWNNHWAVSKEPQECTPNIELIASKFNVNSQIIEPYLQDISDKYDLGKAYETDEYDLNDHWVRCDFMNKLGLQYPNSTNAKWIHIIDNETTDLN